MSKHKLEKSVSESHREYLDLDTDEEEFGKQETPEPEDEAILEPEKPSFTTEELDTLIQQVKDLISLPFIKSKDWNKKCIRVIQEYFCEPVNTVLTIFFERNILKAALHFPIKTDNGLVYFLRSPWQIYDVKNFLSTVIFGSINSKIEKTILSCMENIFAPTAFDSEDWPETSMYDIFDNLHRLIMCLTDIVYSPKGITVLYIPAKCKELDFSNENDQIKNLDGSIQKMGRLERISQKWIVQLQNAIHDYFYVNGKYENSIPDEVYVWVHKCTNLKQLLQQLSNESLILILERLKEENAPSAKQVEGMKEQVEKSFKDAKLNLKYISTLLKKSKHLEKPSDVKIHASDIFHHIKYISDQSTNGIEKLCRTFSMQVIKICRNYIDLNTIFDKGTTDAKEMLEICIACCQDYREIYNQITEEESLWTTIKTNVFQYVIIFEERCQDIVHICNTICAFTKGDNVCPLSSGPKAKHNELRYQEINLSFCQLLQKISSKMKFALDVTSVRWYRCIKHFKSETNKLEQKIERLVNEVFQEDVHNANDSIDMIYTMLEFKNTLSLKRVLLRAWLKTWKLFINEIKKGTKISKIKIGDIPCDADLKKYSVTKLHNMVELCAKMSAANVRMNDYCGISIEEVIDAHKVTKERKK